MTAVAAPVREPKTRPARTRGLGNRFLQRYGTLLILLALCLVFTVVGPWRTSREACNLWQQVTSLSLVKNGQLCAPVFASQVNILNLVRQVSVIGIVALGEMLVILTGGIDLGVGSIVGFTGVVAAALQRDNAGLLPTLAVPLLLGSAKVLIGSAAKLSPDNRQLMLAVVQRVIDLYDDWDRPEEDEAWSHLQRVS